MKNTIISESDGEIASTCIRVLGDFNSQKEDLNKFVNEVLKKSLKKKKFDEDDVELALASIEILDKFTMRQSYLTLMKVLSSKYPTEVKNSAKKTLEKIPNP